MFFIEEKDDCVLFCFGLRKVAIIQCDYKNDKAKGPAENLIFAHAMYRELIDDINRWTSGNYRCGSDTVNEKANYIAHFITHRMYLLLMKINYIFDNYSELNRIFNKLNFDSNNFGSKLGFIVSRLSRFRELFIDNSTIAHDIGYLSNGKNPWKKEILSNIMTFILNTKRLHIEITKLSDALHDICEELSVRWEKPELFNIVYCLCSKMECFLDEEKRLDKDFHAKARKIIDKDSKDKIIVVKEGEIQDVMQKLSEARDLAKEISGEKAQGLIEKVANVQEDLQRVCNKNENIEMLKPLVSETINFPTQEESQAVTA